MAVEWYLMKSPFDQLSGFESDALLDFGQEGFLEALDSELALDVELYNYDLSECTKLRAIFQNRMTDTKLKTLVRHLLAPIGTCHAGMYAKVKGRFWIITGIVDDNSVFEKAILQICNYQISWLDDKGKPQQRWANVISASQYNNGEHENETLTLRSDQLLITIPDDDTSLMLRQNMRFVIDRRCSIYEKQIPEDVTQITSFPLITYDITRVDNVLYNYQDSGIFEFMLTQDEQHDEDGYYVIDGKGYWLCYEPPIEREIAPLHCQIEADGDVIYYDLEPAVFVAKFYDADGNEVDDVTAEWDVQGNTTELLDIEYIGNDLQIEANVKKLVGNVYTITLSADGYEPAEMQVTVRVLI